MVGLCTVVAKTIATVAKGEKQTSFRSTFMLYSPGCRAGRPLTGARIAYRIAAHNGTGRTAGLVRKYCGRSRRNAIQKNSEQRNVAYQIPSLLEHLAHLPHSFRCFRFLTLPNRYLQG